MLDKKQMIIIMGIIFLSGCSISKHAVKQLKLTPYNLVSYYEETVPYLESDDMLEEGATRLRDMMKYNDTFSLALHGMARYHMKKQQYRNALHYFNKLKKYDPVLLRDSYDLYSRALAGTGHFKASLAYLDSLLLSDVVPREEHYQYESYKKNLEFAIRYGKYLKSITSVRDLHIKNMGAGVNSASQEYSPSMSLNGKRIIFTRRAARQDEDLYQVFANDSGIFQQAVPIEELNTGRNEGSASLSSDGRKLLITYCDNNVSGYGSCDIYISYFYKGKGWTPPRNLGRKINTPYWDSQPQFGPNNNVIYFSSNRPGGYGGKDIWLSQLDEDGEWHSPINLGATINTPKDEQLPFMHADNETLYFTSNGWPGYGSSDLFLSKRISEQKWQLPQNLGFPINTIDKEGGLIVRFDAKYAYFSSDKSDGFSQGSIDLYQYELPKEFKPRSTIAIQGKVVDVRSHQGIKARVNIMDIIDNKKLGAVYTSRDGNFLVTLARGKEYMLHIFKNGYLFHSEKLQITHTQRNMNSKTFFLTPITAGASANLNNIYFDTNEYTLKSASNTELQYLLEMMKSNPRMEILIKGHTDNTGNKEANLTLSKQRAIAVKKYLVKHGIAQWRLEIKGMGSSEPLARNNSEKNRAKNRRTEIVIKKL